ncbi:DUF4845 domain-containing protein [Pseudomonadales bacterium]|nr:DUF4845 domain-containing protein [Pseudomonadales bacterium]
MNLSQPQKGLGAIAWLVLVFVFGSLLTLGLKVVPIYTDNATIERILDGLATEPEMGSKGTGAIDKIIKARFHVNNIRDFDYSKNLTIVRDNGGAHIVLDYEVRVPLIYNLDLIASFNKTVALQD